ncbi:MAG: hypothetical protein JOZ96_19620 [Acidobacteria bacterium]|nr:hypothetical protein [Acidobacteriota bacterium]
MGNIIGYACGGLSVAFVIFSIWSAARGGGEGMVPMLVGFALLLVAVFTLKPARTGA